VSFAKKMKDPVVFRFTRRGGDRVLLRVNFSFFFLTFILFIGARVNFSPVTMVTQENANQYLGQTLQPALRLSARSQLCPLLPSPGQRRPQDTRSREAGRGSHLGPQTFLLESKSTSSLGPRPHTREGTHLGSECL
jgi:hypothetical protein